MPVLVLGGAPDVETLTSAVPDHAFRVRRRDADQASGHMADAGIVIQVRGTESPAAPLPRIGPEGPPLLVILTSGGLLDRISALEMGADAVLGPECHPLEVLAQLRALARRRRLPRTGSWRFDPEHGAMAGPDGRRFTFRPAEAELLEFLLRRPGAVVTREEIVAALARRGRALQLKAVDARISRLRSRLGGMFANRQLIETCRGGYRFIPEAAEIGIGTPGP